jgi:phosphatidate cytidylyltransferase
MSRLLTALGLLAVAFYLIFLSPPLVFLAAATLMSLLCYREFAALVAGHGIRTPALFGIIAGLVFLFCPQQYLVTALMLTVIATFIAALKFDSLRDVLPQVGSMLLAAFYTFAPWRFAIDLRAASIHLLFFGLALNWAGDPW